MDGQTDTLRHVRAMHMRRAVTNKQKHHTCSFTAAKLVCYPYGNFFLVIEYGYLLMICLSY